MNTAHQLYPPPPVPRSGSGLGVAGRGPTHGDRKNLPLLAACFSFSGCPLTGPNTPFSHPHPHGTSSRSSIPWEPMFSPIKQYLRWMEEILHHLGWLKPCKERDKPSINWCRISSTVCQLNYERDLEGTTPARLFQNLTRVTT